MLFRRLWFSFASRVDAQRQVTPETLVLVSIDPRALPPFDRVERSVPRDQAEYPLVAYPSEDGAGEAQMRFDEVSATRGEVTLYTSIPGGQRTYFFAKDAAPDGCWKLERIETQTSNDLSEHLEELRRREPRPRKFTVDLTSTVEKYIRPGMRQWRVIEYLQAQGFRYHFDLPDTPDRQGEETLAASFSRAGPIPFISSRETRVIVDFSSGRVVRARGVRHTHMWWVP